MSAVSDEHGGAAPEAAELVAVGDGVYAWVQPDGTWWINNAGAVHGGDPGEVVLIDTCATRRRTELFLAAVDAATGGAPVRVAVNTHLHGDHTYGNAVLPSSTVLVAHELTREGLLADTILANTPPVWAPLPRWGVDSVRVPSVALRDELTVFAGPHRVELHHPGHTAHTPGDVVAWLPEQRVLFSGDLLFHGGTPLVLMGSVPGALRALKWLAAFDPATVVPGHGPVLGAAELPGVLAAHERYYRFVLDVVARGRAEDRTPLEAATGVDLGEFADWPDRERLVLNVHRGYADADGTEVDLVAAMVDAMAWNGGPMSTSV